MALTIGMTRDQRGTKLIGPSLRLLAGLSVAGLLLTAVLSQDSSLEVGWAWIQMEPDHPVSATVLYSGTDGDGVVLWEAAVGAVEPVHRGRLYVETTSRTRTAVALANPGNDELALTAILRGSRGLEIDRQTWTLAAGGQAAHFVDEWFDKATAGDDEFQGTLTLESNDPSSRFAAVTLRENLNGRGEPIYATLPVARLEATSSPVSIDPILVFPQIGVGAGLSTRIILINPSDTPISGWIDIFQEGDPVGPSQSAEPAMQFTFDLDADSVFGIDVVNMGGILRGYAVLHLLEGSTLPAGVAIYQIQSTAEGLTEAGVPAMVPTRRVRMMVDDLAASTGIAVAPLSKAAIPVQFDLKGLDGTLIGSTEELIGPLNGARYANEIFPDLPPGFVGILEASSEETFAAVALKSSTNSRGDFVLTTLPVTDLSNAPDIDLLVIPQIGLGPGLTTRLIAVAADGSGSTRGSVHFMYPGGTPMTVPVFGTSQTRASFEIAAGGGWRFDPSVPVRAADILLDREIVMEPGQSLRLSPIVVDDQGVRHESVPLRFDAIGLDVATVDSQGTITAHKAGFASIVVGCGDVVRSTTVTVVATTNRTTAFAANHIDTDDSGRLFFSSTSNQVILRADNLQGDAAVYAGIPQTAGYRDDARLNALFDGPSFIAMDRDTDTLYVSDADNHKIRTVAPDPTADVGTLELRGPDLGRPEGLAIDREGYLWVADSADHTVGRIDLETGDYEIIAGRSGESGYLDGTAGGARFRSPHGLAVEQESALDRWSGEALGRPEPPVRILVADTDNGVIRRITRSGPEADASWEVETVTFDLPVLEGRGDSTRLQQSAACFESPWGISADAFGDFYVSDTAMGKVSLILPIGSIVPTLPTNGTPSDLVAAPDGSLLVAEGGQGIRRLTFGSPEILDVRWLSLGSGQERITIQGLNFAPESGVLVDAQLIPDRVVVDSGRIVFDLSSADINGARIRVQNRGGLAEFAVPSSDCQGDVVFEDPNLEAVVHETLGLAPDVPVACEWAASVDYLNASGRNIRTLTGLDAFTGLFMLVLENNQIGELAPLAGLNRLKYLYLSRNQISHLEPLASLTRLVRLELAGNRIQDPTPLIGLGELAFLQLDQNRISDLEPLAYFTQLLGLGLSGNQIHDAGPLGNLTQLTSLNLGSNAITDLSPLSGLVGLEQLLLADNQIQDVTPLAGLAHLQYLSLGEFLKGNLVSDLTPLSGLSELSSLKLIDNPVIDLHPLAALHQLRFLYLGHYTTQGQISDLTPLSGLTGLEGIDLSQNDVSDLEPLAGFSQLQWLTLSKNRVGDLTPLEGLMQLRSLTVYQNEVTDLGPLAGMTKLQWLSAGSNQLHDLTPLSGLRELGSIDLSENQITDLTPLAGLAELTQLSISQNQFSDLTALGELTKLTVLDLSRNPGIHDYRPLSGLTGLTQLALSENRLSCIPPIAGLTELRELNLSYNQISDLSTLANLKHLWGLYMYMNQIRDLSPLADLAALQTLLLGHNRIQSLAPLQGLEALYDLDLSFNSVADLAPLVANPGLGRGDYLSIGQNQLDDDDCPDLQALILRGVQVYSDVVCP